MPSPQERALLRAANERREALTWYVHDEGGALVSTCDTRELAEACVDRLISEGQDENRVNCYACPSRRVEYIDTEAAANRLGVTTTAIRAAIERGKLAAEKEGRDWRIRAEDLRAYDEGRDPRGRKRTDASAAE